MKTVLIPDERRKIRWFEQLWCDTSVQSPDAHMHMVAGSLEKTDFKKKKKGLKNPIAVFKITESPNGRGWKEFLQVIMSILPEQTEKLLRIIYQKLKV